MNRTGIRSKMKQFVGQIGRDEFGVNRIYVDIKDIPEDMLDELKTKMNFECADCGQEVIQLTINMQDFKHNAFKGITNTDMYFDCGVCAVGG